MAAPFRLRFRWPSKYKLDVSLRVLRPSRREATDAALGRLLKPDKSMASLGIKPS
jgi:hypothetical protein